MPGGGVFYWLWTRVPRHVAAGLPSFWISMLAGLAGIGFAVFLWRGWRRS